MKISEYIQQLQALANEHGDIEVDTHTVNFDRIEARKPVIAYRKILKGRESKSLFWSEYNGSEFKGDKVVKV